MKINLSKHIKKNPFLLAPMDAVTDIAFREICEKHGASYTTTELTSIDALTREKVFKSKYQKGNLKINAVQLFGSDPDVFVKAAEIVKKEADIIDVNFGCPSSRVTGNYSGSALLQDPKNVGIIIEKLVKYINLPITAKIRLGYKKITYLEVAKEIEDAGASLLTVHGRTAKQKYSGFADWNAIKSIYEKVNIPLVGNGDIKKEEDIDNYLNSHADALMIGRAAIGNPLIFEKFQHYHKFNEKLEIVDLKSKKKELFIEYLENAKKYKFHREDLVIRNQAMWFMKGIEGVSELRKQISKSRDINEILEFVKKF